MRTPSFKRILYAMDMSDNSPEAAHCALRLALNYNARLTIVNVISRQVNLHQLVG